MGGIFLYPDVQERRLDPLQCNVDVGDCGQDDFSIDVFHHAVMETAR